MTRHLLATFPHEADALAACARSGVGHPRRFAGITVVEVPAADIDRWHAAGPHAGLAGETPIASPFGLNPAAPLRGRPVPLSIRTFLGLPAEPRSVDPLGPPTLAGLLGGGLLPAPSDTKVTDDAALCVSAVYACVGLLSDAVATLPVDAFTRAGEHRQEMEPRPRWLDAPNADDLPLDVWSAVMVSLLLRGNAYLATIRNVAGQVVELVVLDPARVTPQVVKIGERSEVRYSVDGGRPLLTRRDVLHIPGLRRPGSVVGMSPIDYARETLSVSLSAQRHGAAFLENQATPSVVVEVPTAVSATGVAQMRETWNDSHRGAGNAGRMAVLTEGAKLQTVSINPEDAELLDTRRFQVADVARIFRVPPHLIGDATGSTSCGSGLAEQGRSFTTYSLRPWLARLEGHLSWLAQSEGRPDAFVRFNTDALVRADIAQRYAAYRSGLEGGFLTLAEVRAFEDLPPLPERETL